jgi:hypothetical protein
LVLDVPFDPRSGGRGLPKPTRHSLAALAGVALLFAVGQWRGWGDDAAVRVAAAAVGHGALLAAALAPVDRHWRRHVGVLVATLVVASGAARWSHWGAVAYLAVPLALVLMARHDTTLAAIGLCRPGDWRAVGIGILAGAVLGAHLLLSASLTLGYGAWDLPVGPYFAAVAYDLGANVPSAECFFRGALFDGGQRRWPWSSAAAVATTAAVLRYLVDPALPGEVEAIAGAVFYLALLSVTNCALFSWSGSLLPGAVAGLGFFGAYRAIGAW